MILRPYQEEAIRRVRDEVVRQRSLLGVPGGLSNPNMVAILLVIATGGGKTFTAGKIILNAVAKGKRCIFLAHRTELIEQCSNTLHRLGVEHGIIKGTGKLSKKVKGKRDKSLPVQVASIQTLIRRKHWDADLVVIDEAHRSYAPTYKKILERQGPNTVVLGLTATPYRADGKPLGEIYNGMIETISTQELTDSGFLMEPVVYGAARGPDSEVMKVGGKGDYTPSSAAKAMEPTVLHGELLTNWAKICGEQIGAETVFFKDEDGRERVSQTNCDACTIVFAPNVKMSKQIAEQFKAAGVRAEHIDGETDDRIRSKVLSKFAAGDISVITNVNLLNEGFDLPRLECVIGARPTRSKSLYRQMGGRLMRPDDDCRIKVLLDHANWTRTHGFLVEPTEHSLSKPEKRPRKNGKANGEPPFKECPQCMAIQKIGTRVCSECQYEWPEKEIIFSDENLIELNGKNVRRADVVPVEERQAAFDRFAAKCVEKGYKPNWARTMYSNVYGEWPAFNTGISMPRFFTKYERELNKKNRQQLTAKAAAEAVSG